MMLSVRQLRLVRLVLLTALLTACGGQPQPSPATEAPAAPPVIAQPTSAPQPTAIPQPTVVPSPVPEPTTPPATSLPEPAPVPSPAPEPTIAQSPTIAPSPPPATAPATSFNGTLLFLRTGALWALDSSGERVLADSVLDFVPDADGTQIALVREVERGYDIWVVRRDGSALRQITSDGSELIEATPAWSPDGATLMFAAAAASDPMPNVWPDWALWCAASQVYVLDLASGQRQALARGCDPAVSPDGRRIAYSAPPTARDANIAAGAPTMVNTIRLINRRGENGWNFARADGPDAPAPDTGLLVYGPAWSPDGASVVYHRYVGMQIEVDINLSEIGGSFEGNGRPLAEGAGWLLPARFAPAGRRVAIVEHNYSDARGFGGYDSWSVQVITLDGTRIVDLPQGALAMVGGMAHRLPRAAAAAWSPDGAALAVLLPAGWRADLPQDAPVDPSGAERPGEVWLWQPGAVPATRLISGVDFASPLYWLP